MSNLLSRRVALLGEPNHLSLLTQCLHGIERECLRVDSDGQLALTPHPKALGSALTHPQITTDYSEALLEFITPAEADPARTLASLEQTHRYTYSKLDGEYLWSPSMPCALPAEEVIPIAQYGDSHIGKLKYVYRQGLALRYGKTMQCIAGIHYNFSLPDQLWPLLQSLDLNNRCARDYQSVSYIAMIRNFRRYSWLLMYLFGASPALDIGFMRGSAHKLQQLDADTLYLPYATSLRMSDLGYQSHAQAELTPCYNDLTSYTDSLRQAVGTPYLPYVEIGTRSANGDWLQLNTNILQIENEYYSSIRPKRVTYSGERPIQALVARGVQYIEVRCLDINPFLPMGINLEQAQFLDAFLLYCALQESPALESDECMACTENFLKVVKEGRRPGLHLQRAGEQIELKTWANELLDEIQQMADLLDRSNGGVNHSQALQAQREKVADVRLTPSAQVLEQLQQGESFAQFSLRQSKLHADYFNSQPLSAEQNAAFEQASAQSLLDQTEIESNQQGDFDTFVAAYQASILGHDQPLSS